MGFLETIKKQQIGEDFVYKPIHTVMLEDGLYWTKYNKADCISIVEIQGDSIYTLEGDDRYINLLNYFLEENTILSKVKIPKEYRKYKLI